MAFIICDKEAGNELERFETKPEAEQTLKYYEHCDRFEGHFVEDFYEIKEVEDPKKELLILFKTGSNEFKTINKIIICGKIYNYEFGSFHPPCLSHTKVISRIRKKLELLDAPFRLSEAKRDNPKSNKYYWTLDKKGE